MIILEAKTKLVSINQKYIPSRRTGNLILSHKYRAMKQELMSRLYVSKKDIGICEGEGFGLNIYLETYLDIDNVEKCLIDAICNTYNLNDKNLLYKLTTKKPQKRGGESYIKVDIFNLEGDPYYGRSSTCSHKTA